MRVMEEEEEGRVHQSSLTNATKMTPKFPFH